MLVQDVVPCERLFGSEVVVEHARKVVCVLRKPRYWRRELGRAVIPFTGPGGGMLSGETLADCARREVLEEIGCPVDLASARVTYYMHHDGRITALELADDPAPTALFEGTPRARDQVLVSALYLGRLVAGTPKPRSEVPGIVGIPLARLIRAVGGDRLSADQVRLTLQEGFTVPPAAVLEPVGGVRRYAGLLAGPVN